MKSTSTAVIALFVLLTCILSAFGEIPAFAPEQMGGTLQRNMSSEPQNLNPITGKDLYERIVNEYVFEALLRRNLDTLELEGVLAESWDVSDDGRVVTFHLKPEARFSDGHPLTADDVVFTYETVINPDIDCRSLASYLTDCERCEKVDDHTVRFVWKKPYFKTVEVSGGLFPVLPKHIYERHVRGDEGVRLFNDLTQGFVGSGPYKFDHWTRGQEIVLVRNEDYWDKPRAFDRILFRLILEDQAAVQEFLSGELDDLSVAPEWWVKLKDHEGRGKRFKMYRYTTPMNGYSFIGWNNARPPFDDRQVRRAMTQLVDRKRLLKYLHHDLGRVATGPFWPLSPQADLSVEPWPFDRAEALRLLAKAGWEDRDGDGWLENPSGESLTFEWTIPTGNPGTRDLARIVTEEFRRTGIDVQARFIEWSVFVIRLDNRDFDAVILGWGGGGVESDPYQIWHSDQIANRGHNFISFRNDEADRLITEARAELDPKRRNKLYHRFHRLLHHQQPYTFFISRESLRLISTRVRGVKVHRGGMDAQEWWFPKEMRPTRGANAP